MKKIKNNKGFTLVELLAVIVILAILVVVAVPVVTTQLDNARKGTFSNNTNTWMNAIRNNVLTSSITESEPKTEYTAGDLSSIISGGIGTNSPFGKPWGENPIKIIFNEGDEEGDEKFNVCVTDGTHYIYAKEVSNVSVSTNVDKVVGDGIALEDLGVVGNYTCEEVFTSTP